jgi:hypothetical protein
MSSSLIILTDTAGSADNGAMSHADSPESIAATHAPTLSPHGLRLEPAAGVQPALESEAWAEESLFRVLLHLEGGEVVEAGSFPDAETAEARARELVTLLAERAWPHIKSRYLRPETVLAVEVSERRRFTG